MTRAQAAKPEQPIRHLNGDQEINITILRKAQKKDNSLEKLWGYASTMKELNTKKEICIRTK